MRYLVTGGAGFIGSALIRKLILDEKNTILNYDNLNYMYAVMELKIIYLNLSILISNIEYYLFLLYKCQLKLIKLILLEYV